MAYKPLAMLIRQRNGRAPPEFGARLRAETGRELRRSVVVERYERAVERSVPKRRQQQAIMHVEPFGITLTLAPGNDVRGPQQGRVGYPGQRATTLPVVHQTITKYVLPDPLYDQSFGLRRAGQIRNAPLEL